MSLLRRLHTLEQLTAKSALILLALITINPARAAVELVSSRWDGAAPAVALNADARWRDISRDGNWAVFATNATNTVGRDSGPGVFLRDLRNGVTRKVVNTAAAEVAISENGKFVVFQTSLSLVPEDQNGNLDVYLWSADTPGYELISGAANGWSQLPDISNDGRFVVFYSVSSDLTANDRNGNTNDVFLKDRESGELTNLSDFRSGGGSRPQLSGDGSVVSFYSSANGPGAQTGWFIHRPELGTTVFAATSGSSLSGGRLDDCGCRMTNGMGVIDLATGNITPTLGNTIDISGDGRFAILWSSLPVLAGEDSGGLYLTDLDAGTTRRVPDLPVDPSARLDRNASQILFSSSDETLPVTTPRDNWQNGGLRKTFLQDTGNGDLEVVSVASSPELVQGANGVSWDPTISADGRYIAFSSTASNLTSIDSNGSARDVFVQDRQTGQTSNLTDGGNGASTDPVISKDGQWLAFVTRANNLPTNGTDTNGEQPDIVLANLATGALTLVTAGADAGSSVPALSRDGRHLVFQTHATNLTTDSSQPVGCAAAPTNGQAECYSNIVLYDRVSQALNNLTQGASSDSYAASINELGTDVVFLSREWTPNNALDVIIMNLDSGVRRPVGFPPLSLEFARPIISPSARWVSVSSMPFSTRTLLPSSVHLFDRNSSKSYEVGGFNALLPGDFSGNERYLAFSAPTIDQLQPDPNGGIRDIYLADLTSAPDFNFERVSVGGNRGTGGPAVNADGTVIAFDSQATNFSNDGNGILSDVFVQASGQTNRPPVARVQTLTVDGDEQVQITLQGFDPDGDPLTFALVGLPTLGSLSGTLPNITYTPFMAFMGVDSFTFSVSDGTSTSATATVSVTSTEAPPIPGVSGVVANPQSISTATETPVAISLTGEDLNGAAVQFNLASMPANGSLTGSLPDLIYTSDVNYTGTDTFMFSVTNGQETSEPATVSITVVEATVELFLRRSACKPICTSRHNRHGLGDIDQRWQRRSSSL